MSIKILMYPKYKVTCYHCGTLFSFEPEDMQYKGSYRQKAYGKASYYVKCPACDTFLPVGMASVMEESNND